MLLFFHAAFLCSFFYCKFQLMEVHDKKVQPSRLKNFFLLSHPHLSGQNVFQIPLKTIAVTSCAEQFHKGLKKLTSLSVM